MECRWYQDSTSICGEHEQAKVSLLFFSGLSPAHCSPTRAVVGWACLHVYQNNRRAWTNILYKRLPLEKKKYGYYQLYKETKKPVPSSLPDQVWRPVSFNDFPFSKWSGLFRHKMMRTLNTCLLLNLPCQRCNNTSNCTWSVTRQYIASNHNASLDRFLPGNEQEAWNFIMAMRIYSPLPFLFKKMSQKGKVLIAKRNCTPDMDLIHECMRRMTLHLNWLQLHGR